MVSYLFCGKSKRRLAKTYRNSYLFIYFHPEFLSEKSLPSLSIPWSTESQHAKVAMHNQNNAEHFFLSICSSVDLLWKNKPFKMPASTNISNPYFVIGKQTLNVVYLISCMTFWLLLFWFNYSFYLCCKPPTVKIMNYIFDYKNSELASAQNKYFWLKFKHTRKKERQTKERRKRFEFWNYHQAINLYYSNK